MKKDSIHCSKDPWVETKHLNMDQVFFLIAKNNNNDDKYENQIHMKVLHL